AALEEGPRQQEPGDLVIGVRIAAEDADRPEENCAGHDRGQPPFRFRSTVALPLDGDASHGAARRRPHAGRPMELTRPGREPVLEASRAFLAIATTWFAALCRWRAVDRPTRSRTAILCCLRTTPAHFSAASSSWRARCDRPDRPQRFRARRRARTAYPASAT